MSLRLPAWKSQGDHFHKEQPIPQPVPPGKQWHASTAGGVVAPPVTPPPVTPIPTPPPVTLPLPVDAGVGQKLLRAKLLAAGVASQSIHFNPSAAIQKRIFADGFVPNSPEFSTEAGGLRYVGQQAEHLGTGEVRVYYVQEGLWDDVQFVGQAAG